MNTHNRFRKFRSIILLLLPVSAILAQSDNTLEVFVSVDGDDRADGSLARPYATIPAASILTEAEG